MYIQTDGRTDIQTQIELVDRREPKQTIVLLVTVSLGKGFGSKGKQHHKHIASETQSHTQ